MKSLRLLFFGLLLGHGALYSQNYFPPNTGFWDTILPAQLGWCAGELTALDSLLIAANAKSFIIGKGGKNRL